MKRSGASSPFTAGSVMPGSTPPATLRGCSGPALPPIIREPHSLRERLPPGQGEIDLPRNSRKNRGEADSSFALLTGPTMFHSGSLSTLSPGLARLQGESFVLVHPADARNSAWPKARRSPWSPGRERLRQRSPSPGRPLPAFSSFLTISGSGGNQLTGWDLRMTRVKFEKG